MVPALSAKMCRMEKLEQFSLLIRLGLCTTWTLPSGEWTLVTGKRMQWVENCSSIKLCNVSGIMWKFCTRTVGLWDSVNRWAMPTYS